MFVVSLRLYTTLIDSFYLVDDNTLQINVPKAVMVFVKQTVLSRTPRLGPHFKC